MYLRKKFEILTYNIGFITKGIDHVMADGLSRGDIIWMRHPYRDRFFADPFLFHSDDLYWYVLCEEYFFWEEKGKITLLSVKKKNFTLEKRKVVIEEKTHLSFPFCKYGGDVIIPESSASNKCMAYTVNRESMEIVSKDIILKEGTIDAVIYQNSEGNWLLTGKKHMPSAELYIYKKNKEGKYVSCGETPVLSDHRHARGAGDFFIWKGKLYRPVQDCQGRYGRQTKIMEIRDIGENRYLAKEYKTVNSFENPPYDETLHTFNVYPDCILVDGSKDELRFPMKFFYRKCRFLFKDKDKCFGRNIDA